MRSTHVVIVLVSLILCIPLVSYARYNFFLPNREDARLHLRNGLPIVRAYHKKHGEWPWETAQVPEIQEIQYRGDSVILNMGPVLSLPGYADLTYAQPFDIWQTDLAGELSFGYFGCCENWGARSVSIPVNSK